MNRSLFVLDGVPKWVWLPFRAKSLRGKGFFAGSPSTGLRRHLLDGQKVPAGRMLLLLRSLTRNSAACRQRAFNMTCVQLFLLLAFSVAAKSGESNQSSSHRVSAPPIPDSSPGYLVHDAVSAGWSLKPLGPLVSDASVDRLRHSPRQPLNSRPARNSAKVKDRHQRRLLSESQFPFDESVDSEMCMSVQHNQSIPVATAVVKWDPCHFADGEERWESSCSDPYFGGSLSCCFGARNNTCTLCPKKKCTSQVAVQCAQRSVSDTLHAFFVIICSN